MVELVSESVEQMVRKRVYLSWKDAWHWGGASRVTGRVGERFTGGQQSSLFLGCHDFLSSCETGQKTHNRHISASSAVLCTVLRILLGPDRDTHHQWRLCSRSGRTWHRFHSRCSGARLSTAVWPGRHRSLGGWCCWSYLETGTNNTTDTARVHLCKHLDGSMCVSVCVCVCACDTLSANHYERYLGDGPVDCELVVEFVNFQETGLIFQTED